MSALTVKQLSLAYNSTCVLKELNFSIEQNQRILITGPSGAGKSSLMHVITGCIPNHISATYEGEIELFGKSLSAYTLAQKIQTINVIFQQPHWQFVSLNVMDELAFGLGSLNIDKQTIKKEIDDLCEHLNIQDLKHKRLSECSLGQQQMIACASILLLKPKILCMDEALSAVDNIRKERFMQIIFDRVDTLIMVDHQPNMSYGYTHILEIPQGVLQHV